MDIPFGSWRIFGFLDNTGFRTTAPGIEISRVMGYIADLQMAFYLGYVAGHGLKIQAVGLPNRMIGSIFTGAWRESDTYSSSLLREHNIHWNRTIMAFRQRWVQFTLMGSVKGVGTNNLPGHR